MKSNPPCNPPANAPADYCTKLRSGIGRLRNSIQALYEQKYPGSRDWIERAVAAAEESAWATPFPSLFFWPLAQAHLQAALVTSPIARA